LKNLNDNSSSKNLDDHSWITYGELKYAKRLTNNAGKSKHALIAALSTAKLER
jgi:hypothetical protein